MDSVIVMLRYYLATTVTLSDKEANELMDEYDHLFKNPNVVSLDYRTSAGQKMLCIGVIKEDTSSELPKVAVYETSAKRVEVPVHIFVQGEIMALAPYEGGSEIKNIALRMCGTVGVNTVFKGKYRLLTCAHVLTEFDDDNIECQRGIEVKHNEDEDFQLLRNPAVTVEGHVPVTVYDSPTPNQENPLEFADQDLAWAKLTVANGLPSIKEIGSVSGIRKPELSDTITFFGAASQQLQRNIPILSNIGRPRMTFRTSNNDVKYAFFQNFWMLNMTTAVALPGDSGSAIIAEVDKAVIGILVCGGGLYAYFCALEL